MSRVIVQDNRWAVEVYEDGPHTYLIIRGQASGVEQRWHLGANPGVELRSIANGIAAAERAATIQRCGVTP